MSVIRLFQRSIKYSSRSFSAQLVAEVCCRTPFWHEMRKLRSARTAHCPALPACTMPRHTLGPWSSLVLDLSELKSINVNVERVSEPMPTILRATCTSKKLKPPCSLANWFYARAYREVTFSNYMAHVSESLWAPHYPLCQHGLHHCIRELISFCIAL